MYIYGRNTVTKAISDNKKIDKLYILKGKPLDIEAKAKLKNIKIEYLSRNELDKMVDGNHQGVIGEVADYKTYSINEIVNSIDSNELPLLVVLDGLEDPHNLGAILRTCDCVKAHGVIYKKHNSVSLNGTVAKVSTGAIDTVKVCEVTNITQTLKELKKMGYWVVGTDMNNASDYRSNKYDMPLVLVIGSEGKGISRLVKEECDFLVKLPMLGTITSLNASVATGILLYEIYSKRNPL